MIVRESGMDMDTLLCLKWMTSKDLIQSTGAPLGVMWRPGWEGDRGRVDTCVCVWLRPFTMHLKLSQRCLLVGYTPVQKKKTSQNN